MSASPKRHMRSYILSSAFLLIFIAWLVWIFTALHSAAPGLIDDGTHIAIARKYGHEGFFKAAFHSFKLFLDGARFYETHYALLGTYYILFGEHLQWWYAANIFLALVSALLTSSVVYRATRNIWPALMSGFLILTSSPTAETLCANFGKAEAIMVALFVAGLALWARCGRSPWQLPMLLGASILFILACITKESGKILALSLCMPWIASKVPLPKPLGATSSVASANHPVPPLFALFLIGLASLSASYLVALPSSASQYMQSYFAMDFSLPHIKSSFANYWTECPDVILMLVLLAVVYAILLFKHRNQNRYLLLGAALLGGATVYITCLLGFQFTLSYYLYVPLLLLALSAGLVFAALPSGNTFLRRLILVGFVLTRFYSIPYLFLILQSQQLFDSVNYKAMLHMADKCKTSVFVLDISEHSQMVQEWNILRTSYSATAHLPSMYGAADGFTAWSYQDLHRNRSGLLVNDRAELQKKAPSAWLQDIKEWREELPKEGDYIACRFGDVAIGKHYLRAVMPFNQSVEDYLKIFDFQSVEAAESVFQQKQIISPTPPFLRSVSYGWKFYKVLHPMNFHVVGCTRDRWLTRSTSISFSSNAAISGVEIELEVPQNHTFPIRIWAECDGKEIATRAILSGGHASFTLPALPGKSVKLFSSSWFQPSKLGLNSDTRELSVRLKKIAAIRSGGVQQWSAATENGK